jgi:hypothetical protein
MTLAAVPLLVRLCTMYCLAAVNDSCSASQHVCTKNSGCQHVACNAVCHSLCVRQSRLAVYMVSVIFSWMIIACILVGAVDEHSACSIYNFTV